MANSYAISTSVVAGRNRVYDAVLPNSITLSMMTISSTVDQQWDIFLDQSVNNLAVPAQPTLTAATTAGTIPRNTKIYVRITTVDSSGIEGQPCDAGKTVTVGSTTDTNKVTVTWTAITGASSYNIYAGTSPGFENLVIAGATGTSYTITALPVDLTRGIVTMPDISVKLAAGVAMPLPVAGQIYVGSKVTVFCTVGGTTAGTAYFSMIGT
jgi:hypothetical protein